MRKAGARLFHTGASVPFYFAVSAGSAAPDRVGPNSWPAPLERTARTDHYLSGALRCARAAWAARPPLPDLFAQGHTPLGHASMRCFGHAAVMAVLARLDAALAPERHVAALDRRSPFDETYAIQVEILRRLRNGGQQTVRVEHVHENDGGQAVIGNVSD